MKDFNKNFRYTSLVLIAFLCIVITYALLFNSSRDLEISLQEDNDVETIISIQDGRKTTLVNINRYEDGGGVWVVDYYGGGVPTVERIE